MAEKLQTPEILEEISKGTNPKPGGSSPRTRTARRRFMIVLVLFVPLVLSTAWLGYRQMNLQVELAAAQQRNSSLTANVSRQQSDITALQTQLNNLPEPVAADNTATDALSARLDVALAELRQELARIEAAMPEVTQPQSSQWKILEANYLVQLANRKLQLEHDPVAAMRLLEEADGALLASGSNAVLGARQAVAEDLTLLRTTELLDREGLYIRLDNLGVQISGIDLLASMRESLQSRSGSADQQPAAEASGIVASGMELLSEVFVWRTWEESPQALLAPGQEAIILQRVQLLVEQAKIALLNRSNPLYQRSLQDVASQIRLYAPPASSAGQQVLAELTELTQIDISPPLPQLNRSLMALEQLGEPL